MNVVDPRKLDQLREIIDSEIVERAMEAPIGRTVHLELLADRLGHMLKFFKVDDWYVATAQDHITVREIDRLGDREDWDQACELDVERRFAMSAVATRAEDAAIALVLRMLDDQADVFFSPDEFRRYYPGELGDFPATICWCLEWYLRADVRYQYFPQNVSSRDRDSVVSVRIVGSAVRT